MNYKNKNNWNPLIMHCLSVRKKVRTAERKGYEMLSLPQRETISQLLFFLYVVKTIKLFCDQLQCTNAEVGK